MTRKKVANLAFYAMVAWMWFALLLTVVSFLTSFPGRVEMLAVASGGCFASVLLAGALSWWARTGSERA